jgi:hypothetical protein
MGYVERLVKAETETDPRNIVSDLVMLSEHPSLVRVSNYESDKLVIRLTEG